jgi:hypothetical protein
MLKLVNEQKLYADALNYFKNDSNIFKVKILFLIVCKKVKVFFYKKKKEISKNFADYLANKKYYQEAGLILLRAKLYKEALEVFDKSNDWRMYLSVSSQLGLKQSEINQMTNKLASNLKDNNKHLEAAIVYEQYLNVENLFLILNHKLNFIFR